MHVQYRWQAGYSFGEVLLIVAVTAIVSVLATPMFISYAQTAKLKGGAQELATVINQARQLAISRNTASCVLQSGNKVRLAIGGCAGTVWTGPGTDASGWFRLTDPLQVSTATANVAFTHLGTATTAGSYTVRDPANNKTMSVNVALSGRVTIGP